MVTFKRMSHLVTAPRMHCVRPPVFCRPINHILRSSHTSTTTTTFSSSPNSNRENKAKIQDICHSNGLRNNAAKLSLSPIERAFWTCRGTWKRAGINTLRCLVGCTIGDFSTLWALQTYTPELGMGTIMALSMTSGLSTSIALETALLHFGKDALSVNLAFKTAMGMSFISMLAMELAENTVDFHLTGGVVALQDPKFWVAAVLSVTAGYLAPLPWNYFRLRRWGRSCH